MSKYYSRKSYYERHVLCCKVLSMSRKADLEIEELSDTPNIRELYILVQELSYKYQKQQAELNSLKRYVEKTKKMLNIVDWLNDNCKGSLDFTKWLDSIKVLDTLNMYLNLIYSRLHVYYSRKPSSSGE